MDESHSNNSCNHRRQGISAQQSDGAHGHSTGTVHTNATQNRARSLRSRAGDRTNASAPTKAAQDVIMEFLYKYVSSQRALTCLPEVGDGTLRATQPSALNDPFECATTKIFVETDSDAGNRQLSTVLTNIHDSTPVSEDDVLKAREQYGSFYMRELMSKQLSRRFGVIAFASSPYHPLMWSHYTVDGSGFVIAYDVEELRNLCPAEDYLRPVDYSKKPPFITGYPVLSDAGNILIFLAHKSDHWEYEREWRLIVELNATIGTGHRDAHDQSINLVRIPNRAVSKVFFTERTPSDAVDEARKRLEDGNNRYRVRDLTKLVLSETEYAYVEADAAEQA